MPRTVCFPRRSNSSEATELYLSRISLLVPEPHGYPYLPFPAYSSSFQAFSPCFWRSRFSLLFFIVLITISFITVTPFIFTTAIITAISTYVTYFASFACFACFGSVSFTPLGALLCLLRKGNTILICILVFQLSCLTPTWGSCLMTLLSGKFCMVWEVL